MPSFTDRIAERMTSHIEAIADEHGIALRWVPDIYGAQAYALTSPPLAEVPVIETPLHYITALHELGHILSSNGVTEDEYAVHLEARILDEAAAWAWAAKNADRSLLRYVRLRDWDDAAVGFFTYVRHAADSRFRPAKTRSQDTEALPHEGLTDSV